MEVEKVVVRKVEVVPPQKKKKVPTVPPVQAAAHPAPPAAGPPDVTSDGGGGDGPPSPGRGNKSGCSQSASVDPFWGRRTVTLNSSQEDQIRFADENGIPIKVKSNATINTHGFAMLVRAALEDWVVQSGRKDIVSKVVEEVVVLFPRSEEISLYANLWASVSGNRSLVRGCRPRQYLVDRAEKRSLYPIVKKEKRTLFIIHDCYFLNPNGLYNLCCKNAGKREHRVAYMTFDFRTPGDVTGESETSMFIGKYRIKGENGDDFVIEHVTEKSSLGGVAYLDHHSRPGEEWEASDNAYGQHEWHHEFLHYSVYQDIDPEFGAYEMTCHVEKPIGGKVLVNVHFRPLAVAPEVKDLVRVESQRLYVTPFHVNYINSRVFNTLRVQALSIPSTTQPYSYTSFYMKAESLMLHLYKKERGALGKFISQSNRLPGSLPAADAWTRTLMATTKAALEHPWDMQVVVPRGSGFAGVAERAAASRIQEIVPLSDGLAAAVSHIADKQSWLDACLLGLRILTELGKSMWRGIKSVWAWLVSCFSKSKQLDVMSAVGGIARNALGLKGKLAGAVNSMFNRFRKEVGGGKRLRTVGEWLRAHPIVDRLCGVFIEAIRLAVVSFAEELVKKVVPYHIFTAFVTLIEAIDDAWLSTEEFETRKLLISVVLRGIAHFVLTLLPLPVAWGVHFMFNLGILLKNVWQLKVKAELSSVLDEYLILECGPQDPVEMENLAASEDFVLVFPENVSNVTTVSMGRQILSADELSHRLREPYSTGGSVALISSNCTDAFGKPVSDLAAVLGVVADRFNVHPPPEIEEVIEEDYDRMIHYTKEWVQPVQSLSLDELEAYVDTCEFSAGKKENYRKRIAKLRKGGPIQVALVTMQVKTDEKLQWKQTASGRWMKMRPLFPMDEVGLWAMAWILVFKQQFKSRMVWQTKFGKCSIYTATDPTQFNLNDWINTVANEKGIHVAIHGDDNYAVFVMEDGLWVCAYDLKSCDLTCGPVHQRKHRWYFKKFGMSQEGVNGMEERASAPREFVEFVNGIKVRHTFYQRAATDTGRPTTSFDAILMQIPIWIHCFHVMRNYDGPFNRHFAGKFIEMFDARAKMHGLMTEWETSKSTEVGRPDDLHPWLGTVHTRSFLRGIFVHTWEGYKWCPLTGVKGTCFVRDPRDVWCKDDLNEALWLSVNATSKDKVARINPITDLICLHYEAWMATLPTPSERDQIKAEKAYRHNKNVYDLSRLDDVDTVNVGINDFLLALGEFNRSRGYPDPTDSYLVLAKKLEEAESLMVRIEEDMAPLWFNAGFGDLTEGPWVEARKNRIFKGLDVLSALSGLHKKLLSSLVEDSVLCKMEAPKSNDAGSKSQKKNKTKSSKKYAGGPSKADKERGKMARAAVKTAPAVSRPQLQGLADYLSPQDYALHAWLATLANPWVENPSGVPVSVGDFELETIMDQFTTLINPVANASGVCYAGLCADAWLHQRDEPQPYQQFVAHDGTGGPIMWYTKGDYVGLDSPLIGDIPDEVTHWTRTSGGLRPDVRKTELPKGSKLSVRVGLSFVRLPYLDRMSSECTYRMVSAGLRVRPLLGDAGGAGYDRGQFLVASTKNVLGAVDSGSLQGVNWGFLHNNNMVEIKEYNVVGWGPDRKASVVAVPYEDIAFQMQPGLMASSYTDSVSVASILFAANGCPAYESGVTKFHFEVEAVWNYEITITKCLEVPKGPAVTGARNPLPYADPVAMRQAVGYIRPTAGTQGSGYAENHMVPMIKTLAMSRPHKVQGLLNPPKSVVGQLGQFVSDGIKWVTGEGRGVIAPFLKKIPLVGGLLSGLFGGS